MITLVNRATGMSLRVLRSSTETSGTLLELEANYPPHSAAPPAHRHPNQEERFESLSGHMCAAVKGALRDLTVGDTLVIRAGETHAMWNPGTECATVNWQVRPALRTLQFFECVYSHASEGRVVGRGMPRLLDLAFVLAHFREEIEVASPPRIVQRLLFSAIGPVARLLGRGGRLDGAVRSR